MEILIIAIITVSAYLIWKSNERAETRKAIKESPIFKKIIEEDETYKTDDDFDDDFEEPDVPTKRKPSNSELEHKKIKKKHLTPLAGADPNNYFYGKKCVFTGNLEAINRDYAAKRLSELGADVNHSISGKTNIVIIGVKPGPSKMKKIEDYNAQGKNIELLDEDQFLKLLDG